MTQSEIKKHVNEFLEMCKDKNKEILFSVEAGMKRHPDGSHSQDGSYTLTLLAKPPDLDASSGFAIPGEFLPNFIDEGYKHDIDGLPKRVVAE